MVQYTATPDYYREYIAHDIYSINNMINEDEYFEHYGIPGMKWGVRKQRVLVGKRGRRFITGTQRSQPVTTRSRTSSGGKRRLTDKQKSTLKKVAIGAGIAAGAGLAAYGGYKLNKAAIKRAQWNDEVSMLRNLERAKQHAGDAVKKKQFEDVAEIYRKRRAAGKYSARHKVRMLLYNE